MDIHAYLQRLHYQGPLEPTLQTLQALHTAHMLAVPFENLSLHYHQPIVLQEEALYEKVVKRRRGGFCYELNGLFAVLLRALGFDVTMVSASMAHSADEFGPEIDHPTLLVHLAEDWLADVGNGDSFRSPLRLQVDLEHIEGEQAYRLQRNHPYWIMQKRTAAGLWETEYRFTLQPHSLSDFIERCHYYQTSPESHFTHNRICSLAMPTGRITLKDLRLITTIHGNKEERILSSEEDFLNTLAERFGVVL
ncbi:arylamine N-acetyltransferase [Ktedonosporobacter rubrisoli]|uniref:Arylamine N-acetyltransferase n=1 Tax=Ktedonosporobacter rubrisoli TaxID=2509675 RepID=A0A4P6K6N9_KTERU|nr:arylamine N-acetyltransferase [Ktedonosporobacter rubrisoli]QBD83286.1 arylamine N-acetyltransferase [Ktedonosporobacter rubrisoli]